MQVILLEKNETIHKPKKLAMIEIFEILLINFYVLFKNL